MDKIETYTQDWYVVFKGSNLKHWVMRWLNPDFRHVYMVREDEGIWLIINRAEAATIVKTELVEDYPHIRQLCPNTVILPVTVRIKTDVYQWHLGISSCVDVCKGLLGIKDFWVWTPYQLYKRITRCQTQ